MARFTVVWDFDVESQFIDLWITSDPQTRAVLTDIANWVDENLAVNPDKKGKARPDLSARILAVPISPARVSVVYQVLSEDRQVRVVRLIFRR